MESLQAFVVIIIALIIYIFGTLAQKIIGTNCNKTGGNESGLIEREYHRYKYVNKILTRAQRNCDKKQKYEARNSIERWLLSMTNFAAHDVDIIFSDEILSIDHPHNKQLQDEFDAKLYADSARLSDIIKIAGKYLESLGGREYTDAKYTINGGTFKYCDYVREIIPDRMKLLIDIGGRASTAVMLMRYACILPGSQHWNIPAAVYREYYAHGIRVEGFASPVNSQLIAIDPKCRFCSIFPDTDKPFGSIGSFFEADFGGLGVTVNPPFIDELFIQISKKLETEMAKNILETKFYITIAAWEDSTGYRALLDSKYTTFAAIMPRGSHRYENSNDGGKSIISTFNTAFFVMGESGRANYDDLFEAAAIGDLKPRIIKSAY